MKAQELMIGDWVQGFISDTYSQIGQTTWNGRVVIFTRNGQEIELNEEDVQPIPLTAEILEKNGIDIHTHCDMSKGLFFMGIKSEDGETLIRKRFIYVHELQHALRLCGLNKLADNLKMIEK